MTSQSILGEAGVPAWLLPPENPFLTEAQETQLGSLLIRILPADPTTGFPGAVAAGAPRFVSLLLSRDERTYMEIPAWRQLYQAAFAALEPYSKKKYGCSLTRTTDAQRDEIIAGLEAGTLTDLSPAINQRVLFRTLLRHAIQGCFSDPRWGGNRDGIAWKWLGYPSAST